MRILSDVRHALDLFDAASAALEDSPQDDRDRMEAWLKYNRAGTEIALARFGQSQDLNGAALLLSELIRTKQDEGWPTAANIDELRLRYAQVTGDDKATEATLLSLLDKGSFLEGNISFLLSQGKLAEAQDAVDKLPKERPAPFSLVVVQYLGQAPLLELDKSVREFIQSGHEYADYARLLLFIAANRATNDEASASALRWINERWSEIAPSTWENRFVQADMTPWQEMLLGYYLGHRSREQISEWIGDPKRFAASPLAATSETREEYLTELYFYDAQLQSVTGDPETRLNRQLDSLRTAISTGGKSTNEYNLAKYQLQELEAHR